MGTRSLVLVLGVSQTSRTSHQGVDTDMVSIRLYPGSFRLESNSARARAKLRPYHCSTWASGVSPVCARSPHPEIDREEEEPDNNSSCAQVPIGSLCLLTFGLADTLNSMFFK